MFAIVAESTDPVLFFSDCSGFSFRKKLGLRSARIVCYCANRRPSFFFCFFFVKANTCLYKKSDSTLNTLRTNSAENLVLIFPLTSAENRV